MTGSPKRLHVDRDLCEAHALCVEIAPEIFTPEARVQVKRMLNERYGLIDHQTMNAALETSPEPREGMRAFMEKRDPNWVPDNLPG